MRRPLTHLAAGLLVLLAGCAVQQKPTQDYDRFLAAQPRSVLIVPVVNESVNVDAPDYFLSTLPVPVAERGYYVFPVNLVKRVLEDEGLADASLVHGADTQKLAEMFGADAVLYATIKNWTAKYVVLSTTVQVEFEYVLKDGKTGETLWTTRKSMAYQPQNTNTGNLLANLIGAMVNAAVAKAAPNYMPLARQANGMAMAYPGAGFPSGPYHPQYGKDRPPAGTGGTAEVKQDQGSAQPKPADPTPGTQSKAAESTSGTQLTAADSASGTQASAEPKKKVTKKVKTKRGAMKGASFAESNPGWWPEYDEVEVEE